MLLAKNEHQQLVLAKEASKNDRYFCPDCKDKLILKQGNKLTAHFSHYKKCDNPTFSEGETTEHVSGKLWLFEQCLRHNLNTVLEAYLPNIQQRPDILVTYKGQLFAIEFQCSRISLNCIQHRTKGYLDQGIKVIWIVGKENAKLLHSPYVYSFPALLGIKYEKEQLYLYNRRQNLPICFIDLFKQRVYEHHVSVCAEVPIKCDQNFLRSFYALGGKIHEVPKEILWQQRQIDGANHREYVLLSYLWVLLDTCKTKEQVFQEFLKLIDKRYFKIREMVCVEKTKWLHYLVNYGLKQLEALNLVRYNRYGKLEKVRKIL